MTDQIFGSCCAALQQAMTSAPNSLFRVEENGVLYLTVGYAETPQGVGWFDQAALFCPFCGSRLQDSDEIKQRANEDESVN